MAKTRSGSFGHLRTNTEEFAHRPRRPIAPRGPLDPHDAPKNDAATFCHLPALVLDKMFRLLSPLAIESGFICRVDRVLAVTKLRTFVRKNRVAYRRTKHRHAAYSLRERKVIVRLASGDAEGSELAITNASKQIGGHRCIH
jgi:hypothetical protein